MEQNANSHSQNRLISVLVNDHMVKLLGHSETGIQIKIAAVEQGVEGNPHDILEELLDDGSSRRVEDHERVVLRGNQHFVIRHEVTVTVNEQPVRLAGHSASGAEIKVAAIAQGVAIHPNFVLQEELPNGTSRIVGDHDRIRIHEHLRFTALAPDDNS